MESSGFHLDHVSVVFSGDHALADVDLTVDAGEAVGLVGSSGAGKTTLLRLISSAQRPTSGSVRVGERQLATLSASGLRRLRSHIGVVHQHLDLVPNLRVIHNVLAGGLGRHSLLGSLRLFLLPPRAEARRVHRILERVGIAGKLYERTDRLSGGERQRVAIARALYQEPAVLLADEPVSSVDPARARDTVGLMTEICRERRLTLCVSLHNLELAREFFPRLVGLKAGRVVFDRPSSELSDADFQQLYDLRTAEPPVDDG